VIHLDLRNADLGNTTSGRKIEICTKFSSHQLRALARKESNRRIAMRMLAIASELDGYGRGEAELASMSDQARCGMRLSMEGIRPLRQAAVRPPPPAQRRARASDQVRLASWSRYKNDRLSAFRLEDHKMTEERLRTSFHIGYMGHLMQCDRRRDQATRKRPGGCIGL
jgi:hypothetical protein